MEHRSMTQARELIETSHLLLRVLDLEAAKTGFTFEQLQVMWYLLHRPKQDVTPAILSREFFKEPHTIVGLLNRLEKIGMVERVRAYDRSHPNWVKVTLSKEGKNEAKRAEEMTSFDALLDNLFEGMGEIDNVDIAGIQKRLVETFAGMTTRRYGVYAANVVKRRAKAKA